MRENHRRQMVQKKEEWLRLLVDNLSVGAVYVVDDGLTLNRKAEEITGYARDDLSTLEAWFRKLFPDDAEGARRRYDSDKQAGFPSPRNLFLRRKDERVCCIEMIGSAFAREELWLLQDVTARHEAEKILSNDKMGFLQALYHTHLMMSITSIGDGTIVDANDAFCKALGLSREEIVGKTTIEVGWISASERRRLIDRLKANGRVSGMELSLSSADGRTIVCDFRGEIVSFGGTQLLLGIGLDITPMKQAQDRLRFQADLLNAVGQAVIATDLQGRINFWNPFAESIYGWRVDEVLGLPIQDLIPDAEWRERMEGLLARVQRGECWKGEFLQKRKDGSSIPIYLTTTPLYDQADSLRAMIGVVSDISGIKQTEALLRRLNRTLMALDECNQAVLQATDESQLLHRICEKIVVGGGYRLAWVGFPEAGGSGRLRLVAHMGDLRGYLDDADLSWGGIDETCSPTTLALQTRKPAIAASLDLDPLLGPWCRAAGVKSFGSLAALPLLLEDRVIGVLNICADDADAFDEEELRLLGKFAENLAFGIDSLRVKEEHRRAKEALELSEARLKSLYRISQSDHLSEEELIDFALTEAIRLTGSKLGYFYAVENEKKGTGVFLWLNDAAPGGKITRKTRHLLPEAGVWAGCLRLQRTVIHNGDQSSKDEHGYPEGHPDILRQMTVPVVDGGRVVAVAGAANKEAPYDEADVFQLQLFVSEVWRILSKRRAVQKLVESSQFNEAIISNASEAIIVYSPDLRYVLWNKAAEELTGIPAGQVLGKSIYELFPHMKRDGIDLLLKRALKGEQVTSDDIAFEIPSTGKSVRMRGLYGPQRNSEGEIIGVIGIARDVSERWKAQQERESLEQQLRQAQKLEAIGTLAGGIAHDFNNILTPIIGYTEMAMADLPEGDSLRCDLKHVLAGGYRAKDLVSQILTFSRRSERERDFVRIAAIIREALKLVRASLPATIKIRQDLGRDVGRGMVLADATQMHQIIMNLCTNAADAMSEKGGTLTVRLTNIELDGASATRYPKGRPGSYVMLAVEDTGCGMPEEVRQRVFDPYFTTKEKGKGTGLGLAIVFGIVENHGGLIGFHSEVAKGTVFQVLLPRIEQPAARKRKTVKRGECKGSGRVLLVDDEEVVVRTTRRMLEFLGYEVLEKTSSLDALKAFRADPQGFDFVFTDQTMPDLTGAALATEILKIRPDLPVILCTGFSKTLNETEAEKMGIKAYLMKPVTLEKLRTVMQKAANNTPAKA